MKIIKKKLNKYKWNFDYLYKNVQEWKNDLFILEKKYEEIINLKGKLDNKLIFKKYLLINKEINYISSKIFQYIRMKDIDKTNLLFQDLSLLLDDKFNKFNLKTSFIYNEIKLIGFDKIINWIENDPEINQFKFEYIKFFRESNHFLSEEKEEIISIVEKTRKNSKEIYELLSYADKKPIFIFYKNKRKKLTNSLYNEIMQNSKPIEDQKLRIKIYNLFSKNLINNKYSFSKIYEGIIQYNFENCKLRKFNSILNMFLINDNVSEKIYKNLIEYGKKTSYLVKKYFILLKNFFNFKNNFYITDQNLKIINNFNIFDNNFDIEFSKKIIKNSLSILGNEYLNNLEIAWSDNKIDYFESTNKRIGAYSTGGNGVDPIILMNWDYSIYSINTLAHELGHSVHTLFSDKNNKFPLNQYSIISAEIASTINEFLLFDYLYKKTNNINKKIFLLQNRIFEIISTFYRQIQFADFEYSAHKIIENNSFLNHEKLANLFLEKSKEFGWDVFDNISNSKYTWPRILHFFESPFYVYKYAISISASFRFYNFILDNNSEKFINFLKLGGSNDPLILLEKLGINFNNFDIYKDLTNQLSNYIKVFENLLKKIKNK